MIKKIEVKPLDEKGEKSNRACGSYTHVRKGYCGDGDLNSHEFYKAMKWSCKKPWCRVCPDEAKMQRVMRVYPKAQKMEEAGFLTITPHPDFIPKTQKELMVERKAEIQALKAWGFKRFLARFHPFGEKNPGIYNPHNHYFVGGGSFMDEQELECFKNTIRYYKGTPDNHVIHYEYSGSVHDEGFIYDKNGKAISRGEKARRMMIHWLKYMNRNTFLKRWWDCNLADELANFKYSFSRGNEKIYSEEGKQIDKNGRKYNMGWKGVIQWEFKRGEEIGHFGYVDKIRHSICPLCGKDICWTHRIRRDLILDDFEEIWPGIYQRAPPDYIALQFYKMKALQESLDEAAEEACQDNNDYMEARV